jgi:hypothetical protein
MEKPQITRHIAIILCSCGWERVITRIWIPGIPFTMEIVTCLHCDLR